MAPPIALNSDIRIEIFRLVAIQEGHDGFQQPLVFPSLRDNQIGPASETLFQDALVGYERADVPIYLNNVAAFNAVRGMEDWVQGVRLIWVAGQNSPDRLNLRYRNSLKRIVIDLTNYPNTELPYEEFRVIYYIVGASRLTPPPNPVTRRWTLQRFTLLVDRNNLCPFYPEAGIRWFTRCLGVSRSVSVDGSLRKLVWTDMRRFLFP